jgi:hypothetical protein
MEMAYAILALGAHMEPDGRLFLLNGGLDFVSLTQDPDLFPTPLFLAGKINFAPEECGREHEVQIDLVAPDGRVLQSAEPNRINPLIPNPPARVTKSAFVLQFSGIAFPSTGRYTFRLRADGHRLAEVDLIVKNIESPQQGTAT